MLEEQIMQIITFSLSLIIVILICALPRKNERFNFSKHIKYGEFKSTKRW